MSANDRIPVAVLGATGSVGQRFVQLLADHPWFRVAEVVASDRSTGKRYRDAADWRLGPAMPKAAADLVLRDYGDQLDSPVVFSALPGEVAGEIEQRMAREGRALFSNTSTHRMDPRRPPDHPRGQPRPRRRGRHPARAAGLERLHRRQPELLGDPPRPRPQTAPAGVRPRRPRRHHDAGRLRRRLPGRPLARRH
jgi:hypothetical protein